jgi:hypothetical protein
VHSRNVVRGPIEPTVPQLESWAVSDNGASEDFNLNEVNNIWFQHRQDLRVSNVICRRMVWLRIVGMFLDYKFAHSTESDCTELLDVFSPADALHIKYPLDPIKMYKTKHEIDAYRFRLGSICIAEIGDAQAMMEMIKNEYPGPTSLQEFSTDIVRMHIGPELWYQQHILDSDAHHLNHHMLDMVWQYMRGDATRM